MTGSELHTLGGRLGAAAAPPPGRNQRLGRLGEAIAVHFGRHTLGWQVLDTNWRCRWGEIDIVARDGRELVVCEVKARQSRQAGTPLESVTTRKVKRLLRLGELWLEEHPDHRLPLRLDAIGVQFDPQQRYAIQYARGI